MKKFIRTGAVGATVLSMLSLAACGGAGESAEGGGDGDSGAVSIAFSDGIYINLPIYVAQSQGFFEDHGVDLSVVSIPSGGQVVQSVATDSTNVGLQTPATMQSTIEAGDELVSFCGVTDGQANYILGPTDTELPTAEEAGGTVEAIKAYEGKSVGLPALGGVTDNSLKAVAEEAGVKLDSAAIGAGPSAVAAFEKGNVDLVWGYPFIAQQLLAENKAKVLVDFKADGPASIGSNPTVLFATSAWLDDNEETARNMCAAMDESIEYLTGDEGSDAVKASLKDNFGVTDESVVDLVMEDGGVLDLFTTKLPTCKEWKTAIETEVSAGSFTGTEDCEGYFRDLTGE